jgi:hypothetical protein
MLFFLQALHAVVSHKQANADSVACVDDNDVIRGRAMIVLGLSASLIAISTLAAISLLLNIDFDRQSTACRVF